MPDGVQTSACRLQHATQRSARAQVAVYNYMKLQMIQAKAALSTGKDAEKGGGAGGLGQAAPQLTADARSPTASARAPAQTASAEYTSFRRAACLQLRLGAQGCHGSVGQGAGWKS